MDMKIRSEKAIMANIVVSYSKLWCENGLKWIINSNPKVAVSHVPSRIRLKSKIRIEKHLEPAPSDATKDYSTFIEHALNFSKDFRKRL